MPRHFSTHRIVCWRLSLHCNRWCSFCLSRSTPKKSHPIRDSLAVLSRLKGIGVEKISYSGGEPTLVPDFPQIVQWAEELGFLQLLTTNGDRFIDSGIPDWVGSLEYLKLSFYGTASAHDRHMGEGHYLALLELAADLSSNGHIVSANYMLTPESVLVAGEFLEAAHAVGVHDVMFQTYIHNGRRTADDRYRLLDHEEAIAEVRYRASAITDFPGGVKVHDYSKKDWFIVLDEASYLTLPASDGSPDHVLGHVMGDELLMPSGVQTDTAEALEHIWSERYRSDAIVVVA